MTKKTTTYITSNGSTVAVEGIKACYDKESKTYTTKAVLKVSAKWYKARLNKKGEVLKEERVVFTSRKNLAMVCTRMGKKIKFAAVPVAKSDSYDAESLEALEKSAKDGFEALKKYMIAKFELNNMNWETMLKKIGAMVESVEVVEEATETTEAN